ncbi:hypothetical protein KNJ79_19620 [Sphingopyxis indica]|uniref:hypothetical protein n=1 Tax=Sphingopyxis indica TaxID=436663 RepID=UPI002938F041|nr:hypothetical protein [Sphingopyxis indica]WOF43284.1 hypothetical protein KNJ79_19620 [Sphingopyxis indica]
MDDESAADFYGTEPRYRKVAEIGTSELYEALMTLAGFAENPFLAMQASQLCLVDNMLNGLEDHILKRQLDDEKPRSRIAQLSALTPMWIYAAYELLRTWRQRCEEVIKLAENGGFGLKATNLERDLGYRHYDRELRAQQLRDAEERPDLVAQMRHDLRRTEMGFTRLEFLRVALAKHEVSKKGNKKPIAFAPGLAMIDRYSGSMQYELSNGGAIIGFITRRDVAETIRFIPELEEPSDEDLSEFRAYMNPPDVEPPA